MKIYREDEILIEMDDKADSDGEIFIETSDVFINRSEAIQIIDHLTKVFDIKQYSEIRPETMKILAATCPGCGGLFEFFYKQDNQKCHICNDGVLVFHDSMVEAIKSLTPFKEKT